MGNPNENSPFFNKKLMSKLSLNVDTTLKLKTTELNLALPNKKSLFDACSRLSSCGSTPGYIDFKQLPKRDQSALMKSITDALNDFRNSYYPSIHPGDGVTGEAIRGGLKATIGYEPTFLPNELVLYINRDGDGPGGGVGIKFKTDSFRVELGVHYLPNNYKWEVPGVPK